MRNLTTVLAIFAGMALAPCTEAGLVTGTPILWTTYPYRAIGESRRPWPSDFGVAGGRCNARLVGTLVGGPGGLIRHRGAGNSIATLKGSVPGYAFGPRLGPGMDAVDRGCIGHTLELAPSFATVHWVNPYSQAIYRLTPTRRLNLYGAPCRQFSGHIILAGNPQPMRGTACRAGYGVWRMV